jgi:oxaloacetate decarboxylase alpha subunit
MAELELIDVSLRDGNQSLWSGTGITTPHVLELAPLLDRAGFRALDFTSSTHMGISVRTHREDPWERIRLTHRAMPNTRLQFIGTGLRFISWESVHPDFMQLAYDRLVANGMSRFMVMDPMHDWDAMAESARMIRRAGADEIVGALVYTISPVHDDAFYARLATRIAGTPEFDRAYIKDPTGLLTPERARTLIPAVRTALGGKPLELHSHTTIGLSPLTYLEGAGLGVAALHVACGPLANGSSLPSAQTVVANLAERGHTARVHQPTLARVVDHLHRVARADGLPAGAPQEYDAAFLRHQLAGGTMTTTRRQLAEVGLEDRFDHVIDEVARVRAELGYPIMVTPFPQMVVGQALANVIGAERYANVSDQIIRYVLGRFGRPTAPVDPAIQDRILDRPRARQLAEQPPAPELAELRRRFPGVSDEEFLLRATMPAEQVDAMVVAGPARRRRTPELQPLVALLSGLSERPPLQHLRLERPDFTLEIRR